MLGRGKDAQVWLDSFDAVTPCTVQEVRSTTADSAVYEATFSNRPCCSVQPSRFECRAVSSTSHRRRVCRHLGVSIAVSIPSLDCASSSELANVIRQSLI